MLNFYCSIAQNSRPAQESDAVCNSKSSSNRMQAGNSTSRGRETSASSSLYDQKPQKQNMAKTVSSGGPDEKNKKIPGLMDSFKDIPSARESGKIFPSNKGRANDIPSKDIRRITNEGYRQEAHRTSNEKQSKAVAQSNAPSMMSNKQQIGSKDTNFNKVNTLIYTCG